MNRYQFVLSIIFFSFSSITLANSVTGPTSVTVNETHTYILDNNSGGFYIAPSWVASGGSIISTWQSGSDYYASVKWTSTGSRSVSFKNGSSTVSTLNVTVAAATLNGGSISASTATTVCHSTDPGIINNSQSPSGGTGSFSYQWQQSTYTSGSWGGYSNISGATSSTYNPGSLLASRRYRRRVTSGSLTSYSNVVTYTVYGQLNAGSIGNAQTLCYNGNPSTISNTGSASGASGSYSYQWQYSTNGSSGWTNISGATGTTYNPGNLTSSRWYRRRVQSCGSTQYTNSIKITIYSNLNAGSINGSQTLCYNGDPSTLGNSASASGGNSSKSYQWQYRSPGGSWSNISGATSTIYNPPALTSTKEYRRRVISCGQTKYTNSVTVTIRPNLNAGSIGNAQTLCYNGNPSTLTNTGTASGGDGLISYQWQYSTNGSSGWTNISGATSTTYNPGNLTSSRWYRRRAQSCGETKYTNSVKVTIHPNLNAGSIGNAQTVCYNGNPSALSNTGTASGGNGSLSYQWQYSTNGSSGWTNIGGATGTTYDPGSLTSNRWYRRRVQSCGQTKYTNSIKITVQPDLNPGSITGTQTICYNDSPSTLTTNNLVSGGNGSYSYQWQHRSPGGSWSNISGATSHQYSPGSLTSTKEYRRRVVSCGQTKYTNAITVTVHPNLSAGTIGNAQTLCYNSNPAALTNTGSGSGGNGSVVYQWQYSTNGSSGWTNISGATGTTYDPGNLTSSRWYRRRAQSCGLTKYTNSVKITIYPNLSGGTINGSQTVCYNGNPSLLGNSSSASGGNGTLTYQWQYSANGINGWTDIGSTNSTTYDPGNLTSNRWYRRKVTSCGQTQYSNSITITVEPDLNPGTIAGAQTLCYNGNPNSITTSSTASGGDDSYSYQWQERNPGGSWSNISGATASSYNPPALTGSKEFRKRVISCGQTKYTNTITVTIRPDLTAGTIGDAQTICYDNDPSALTNNSSASGGDGVIQYQWQVSTNGSTGWISLENEVNSTYDPDNLTSSRWYRRKATSCGQTKYSNPITINVEPDLSPGTITGAQTLCYNDNPLALSTSSNASGGDGIYSYQWQERDLGGSWSNISGATASSYDPPVLTGSTEYRMQVISCGQTKYTNEITITIHPGLSAGTIGNAQNLCYNEDPAAISNIASASGGDGLYSYQWQILVDGQWNNIAGETNLTYNPSSLTETTEYRRAVSSCGETLYSNQITMTVQSEITPGSISYIGEVCSGSSPGMIDGTTPTGGSGPYEYQWQFFNGSWQTLETNALEDYDPTINITAATKFRRRVRTGTCTWQESNEITIPIIAPITNVGTLSTSITDDVCPGETVSLSFTKGDTRLDMSNARLVVVRDGQVVDLGALTNNGATYDASVVTYYQDQFKLKGVQLCTGAPIYSNVVTFGYSCNQPPSLDQNFVRTEVPKVPVSTDEQLSILFVDDMATSYAYVDALGREEQIVSKQASPLKADMVQTTQYDELGRKKFEYLPYVDGSTGAYQVDPLTAQANFYSSTDKVASDTRPFTEHTFDNSPLNRVVSSFMPGADWYTNDKKVSNDFRLNSSADGVIKWKIVSGLPDGTDSYLPNELRVDEITGEDDQVTQTFTNPKGQVILKRVKADEIPSITWYDTYYVYDHLENLRFVIPPKLVNQGASPSAELVFNLGFEYRYDDRKRMIMKQVPGADSVLMVYDQWDRLVMTQDGNQRDDNLWMYTKYDHLNRPIITGFVTDNSDRMDIQISLNGFSGRFESRATNEIGYTLDLSYPTNAQITDVQTVTFYDDYNFKDASWSDLAFTAVYGQLVEHEPVKGQVTGTMTRIIDGGWLKGVTYYDDRYRPIQTIAENHVGGIDKVSSKYRFDGVLEESTTDHTSDYESVTVLKAYEYDHADRLLREYNTINGGAEVMVVDNQYNELGELVEKNLHSTDDGANFLQSVDQRYNIRGWLTDINHHALSNDGVINDDANDLFGMRLSYNQDNFSVQGGSITNLYSGNIAGVRWSTDTDPQSANSVESRAYRYEYDLVNRLTGATYGAGASFGGNEFYSMDASYDENGNILMLNRNGNLNDGLINMDGMTYDYQDVAGNPTNRLQRIDESGDLNEGFTNPSDLQGKAYFYDKNGNMDVDMYKDMAIDYNHLNLPKLVTFGDGKTMEYTYDAAGIKLSQTITEPGASISKVTDYTAVGVYEDQDLSFLFTAEGRALKFANSFGYEYNLKDHLGNTRVAFGDLPNREEYKATMETENSAYENSYFEFPTNIRVSTENRTPLGNESVALNGEVAGRQVGPAKVLNITAGDKIELEVWAKYTFSSWNNTSVSDIASVISNAFGGASAGTGGESASSSLNNALSNPGANGLFTNADTGEPRAYLQYLFFDQSYAFDQGHSGFIAVGPEAEGAFAKLEAEVDGFTDDGYLFVYIVNESNQNAEVYFDDLKIVQESAATSLVVNSAEDYYPFGLSFNSYTKPSSEENKYKYNQGFLGEKTFQGKEGKFFRTERVKELGLDITKFRMYDYSIGRFINIDPLADQGSQEIMSPYQYAYNNPVVYNDPNGDCPTCISGAIIGILTETTAQVGYGMLMEGRNFGDAISNVDVSDVAVAGAVGFITGALDGGVSNFAKFVSKSRNRRMLKKVVQKGIEVVAETAENVAKDYFNDEDFDLKASISGALAEVGLGSLMPTSKQINRQIKNSNKTISRMEKKIGKGKSLSKRQTRSLASAKRTNKAYNTLKNSANVATGAVGENVGNGISDKVRVLDEVVVTPGGQ